MIEVSTPGKLFIAGEYAVVEPGHPAIIVAVDQFVTVTLESAENVGSIQSAQYSSLPVRWTRRNNELVLDIRENPFHYVLAAIRLTEKYAQEQQKELAFYHLKVTSELDNSNGRKYGLGSSGAVTVATVKSLSLFYDLDLSEAEIFKLSALAHLEVQGNGSCGDIAASCYGGWIAFSTFDHQWVNDQAQKQTLTALLQATWPKLMIKPLTVPKKLRLLIGWTGSPASTSDLVDQVNQSKEVQKNAYQKFLDDSKTCVETMITGFDSENISLIQTQIRKNRQLLQQLTSLTGVTIETPALKKLCNLAQTCSGAANHLVLAVVTVGIVIFKQKSGILPLMSSWEKEGITPLPLHVYFYGKQEKMNRKDEHISLAKAFHKEKMNDFDQIKFIHHSFSEIALDEVDISTTFFDFTFKQPFYINAMTGGSERAKDINQQLGIIARETGVMVATGSVNAALKNPGLADTYQIMRKENPTGAIWANIGAGLSLDEAKRAVDLFQADGLQIHVNVPQELVMPEGDRDFHGWLDTIEDIVSNLSVPVIVKEVGFGMSSETIEQLVLRGVKAVDVSGQGGTSFTQIENARRKKRELGFLTDWGQSTVLSLLESINWQRDLTVLASGGVRQSLDIVKALSLGAKSVGIAGTILNQLMKNGVDDTIALIQQWEEELKMLYTLLGKKSTSDLTTTDIIFSGEIIHWCESRGIAYQPFAKRSK